MSNEKYYSDGKRLFTTLFPLSSLWLPCWFLAIYFQRYLSLGPGNLLTVANGALSSTGTCYQTGGWQLWTPAFQKFPEKSALLQNAGILFHRQVLSCLRNINEYLARGWRRPNLRVFLTLSSQDPKSTCIWLR